MEGLIVENLNVSYGMIHAIHDVSLKVPKGSIVAFIGANGAGKTTILRTISRLKKADSGKITLDGVNLLEKEAHMIIDLGMSHVPEGRQVFATMTVEENLEMGAYPIKDKKIIKENLRSMYKKFPRLKERRKQAAGTLSGGEQQMLATARALMINPRIILMDEPSMGLSPILVNEIFAIIKEINKAGTTVLLVEQNAKMALSIADYAYVIETGRIVLEGEAKKLLENDDIKKAYLGG
ncbi:MAG TPA: ABC transporter ATP-binding protein [Bacilli bacterium]|nr:ABC transporter ATP-binding protein [Bacilli bacterium]